MNSFERRLFEALQILIGDRGNPEMRALRVKDLERISASRENASTIKRVNDVLATVTGQGESIDNILVDLVAVNQKADDIAQDLHQLIDALPEEFGDFIADLDAINLALNNAQAARDQAEAARDQAEAIRDQTEAFKNTTEAARNVTTAARDQAQSAALSADSSAGAAFGYAEQADTARTQAGVSATAAAASVTLALAAQEDAQAAASASNTSANSASASAGNAESSAAASLSERQASQTARSGAESARDTAVIARDSAESAASTATMQAGIATTARTNAENAATASANSASIASTQASNAESSATAANTNRINAETAASNAGVARDQAVTARDSANDAAALAGERLTVAAAITSQGVSVLADQFLALSNSQNWSRVTAQGALTRPENSLYAIGNDWRFEVAAGQGDGLETRSDRAIWRGAKNADAYVVEVDFTLESGTLDGAGFWFDWINTSFTSRRSTVRFDQSIAGPVVLGEVMTARAYVEPATPLPGTFNFNRIYVWANRNDATLGNAPKTIRFHRVSIRVATDAEKELVDVKASVTQESIARVNADAALATNITTIQSNLNGTNATVSQQASAISTLEGNASAMLAFRAKAGSGGATLELIAADNPSGPTSIARVDATDIILNGSVTAAQLSTSQLITTKAQMASAVIGSAQIEDAAVTNAKIENAAITTAKIEDAAIATAKIGDLAVNTFKIAGNAVTIPRSVSASPPPRVNGTWINYASLWIDPQTDGALFVFWYNPIFMSSSGGGDGMPPTITVSTRLLWRGNIISSVVLGTVHRSVLRIVGSIAEIINNPGSGAGELQVQYRVDLNFTGDGSSVFTASNTRLIVLETKR